MSALQMPIAGLRVSRRDLRLASGLVLFAYVTFHLACHALGLVSVDLAQAALDLTLRVWRSPPGTLLLYGAAAVHVALALQAIYERRTLRQPAAQWVRMVLGLVMPIGLIGHFMATRYAFERYGLPGNYARVIGGLWGRGAQGLAFGLLAPGWVHGCLGLRFAFGHRAGWQRWRPVLFGFALLLPVLAGLGFVTLGRSLAEHPPVVRQVETPVALTEMGEARQQALWTYGGLVALVVLGRVGRRVVERRRRSVVWLSYPGRRVSVPRGWSVLDASRAFGIAHPSACGGRGRCTTCRVRVTAGIEHCPSVGDDATVRLACQLRPAGDVTVEPMLSVAEPGRPVHVPPTVESDAVLLRIVVRPVDPAGRDPHDLLHALRAATDLVLRAVATQGGTVCNREGAKALVLFDARRDVRKAIAAADAIGLGLGSLAGKLKRELGLELGFALALHAGQVLTGAIGSRVDPASHARVALGPAVEACTTGLDGHCRVSVAMLARLGEPADQAIDPPAGHLASRFRAA
jgi:adenylate cyclase